MWLIRRLGIETPDVRKQVLWGRSQGVTMERGGGGASTALLTSGFLHRVVSTEVNLSILCTLLVIFYNKI